MVENERVCVTGAGGYQASWLVKLLLSKGFIVHGTVRDPSDEKNAHLLELENARENLKLFKAELLDYDSLYAAIDGCSGVFHVASPIPLTHGSNPEVTLVEPAVKGTLNVLKACSLANVKKVVVVSSVASVALNPNWPKDKEMDESCWSDKEFCKKIASWYCLSKTAAESLALEYGTMNGLNVVSVCPPCIFGPMLQSTLNTSTVVFLRILKDGLEILDEQFRAYVDVRDVAEALLLVYENPEAEGRYICSSHYVRMPDLVDKLKSMYPNYNYPKQITELGECPHISSEKLKKIGWTYRPLEETLVDTIKDYQSKRILPET